MKRNVPTAAIVFVLTALTVMLQAGACSGTTQGKGDGECDPALDDGNPCTKCVDPSVKDQEPVADGEDCSLGLNSGTCMGGICELDCGALEDCPIVGECQDRTCAGGKCQPQNKASGFLLEDGMLGDCLVRQCDGKGQAVEVVAENESCDEGNGFCNSSAKCVSCISGTMLGCDPDTCYEGSSGPICSTCGGDNTAKDGEETDVNCGGPAAHQDVCPKCEKAKDCSVDADCADTLKGCRQGVCCDGDCMNPCRPCNAPWNKGTCTALPVGTKTEKIVSGNPVPCVCDNLICVDPGSVKGVGASCKMDKDCLTQNCASGTCKLGMGKGCFANEDCANGTCDADFHCK